MHLNLPEAAYDDSPTTGAIAVRLLFSSALELHYVPIMSYFSTVCEIGCFDTFPAARPPATVAALPFPPFTARR